MKSRDTRSNGDNRAFLHKKAAEAGEEGCRGAFISPADMMVSSFDLLLLASFSV